MVGCKTICLKKFCHLTYADCHTTGTLCGVKNIHITKQLTLHQQYKNIRSWQYQTRTSKLILLDYFICIQSVLCGLDAIIS